MLLSSQKMPLKFIKTQGGFSLIELLVVISIIGLVTGVGASFVSSIQRNTRDAQREADLRVLQSALQQYYANENFYPDNLTVPLGNGSAITNCTGRSGVSCTVTRTYLSQTPKDPVSNTTTPYCYKAQVSIADGTSCTTGNSGKCHFYTLCANLENPSNASACSCGAGNFSVTPL